MNSIDDLFCKLIEMNTQVECMHLQCHKSETQSQAEYTYHLIRQADGEVELDLLVN